VTKLRHQADNRTDRRSFLNFYKIPQNSVNISKFRGKKQIPRLGSKFRGPRKTMGPIDNSFAKYILSQI